ncbi:hypothetical protein [Streptomyces sp. NPDC017230]|uniref:hypothetical protein n=1 Tax=Streptomyces sp. NPDC017230 TaxID=3364984 RepID=UPI00379689F5
MRAKISYVITAAVLVFYFALAGSRGVLLIGTGTPLTVTFGVAVLILPVIGVWFLWKNTQFVRKANQLAAELDAEGGLPVDELKRTPSGRVDRESADAVFALRKAETEDAPGVRRRALSPAGTRRPTPPRRRPPGRRPRPVRGSRRCASSAARARSPWTGPAGRGAVPVPAPCAAARASAPAAAPCARWRPAARSSCAC